MSGVVYFIGYGRSSWVKVGYATNVQSRLSTLRVSSPEDLTLIATVPATMRDERELHASIWGPRRREWFTLTMVEPLIDMANAGEPIKAIIEAAAYRKARIEGRISHGCLIAEIERQLA